MLITLKGVCRFDIVEELATCRGYRRVSADWSRYQGDFDPETAIAVDRDRLLDDLKSSFEVQGIAANWDAIQERSEEHTSELQSPMRISYAVFCLKTQNTR